MLGNNMFHREKLVLNFCLILILLITTLLFTSCDYYQRLIPAEAKYHTGIKGLELTFLDQAPQDELYENSRFVVGLMVENSGAYDVIEDRYGILSLSFDPFYIDASEITGTDRVQVGKNSILFKGIQLNGKSLFYPTGTFTFMSFSGLKTKEIMGQREKPSTQLLAALCYPYTTTFSDLICVDLSLAGLNLRKQVCYQNDLSLSNQGAPLAITKVEVENQPAGNVGGDVAVRPVFTIHIENKGSGTVLSPASDAAMFDRVCSFESLLREDFNTVNVEATLSTSRRLICNPNPVKLYEGTGFSRCEVSDEDLIVGHHNYQAPLTVILSYVYLTSVSKEIDIKRLNLYSGSPIPSSGCLPFEIERGGTCINRCDYCAETGGGGDCQPANARYSIQFEKGFACQCSDKTCNDLYPKGLCVPYANYCPGASYCCMPNCLSSEVRIDGKCYPRCSQCPTNGAVRDCACGDGDDPLKYTLIGRGSYCCKSDAQGYTDKQTCLDACKAVADVNLTSI